MAVINGLGCMGEADEDNKLKDGEELAQAVSELELSAATQHPSEASRGAIQTFLGEIARGMKGAFQRFAANLLFNYTKQPQRVESVLKKVGGVMHAAAQIIGQQCTTSTVQ